MINKALSKFISDTSGNLAITTAIVAPIALMVIGAAVSMAQVTDRKAELQSHADIMSLAMAKHTDETKAQDARNHFREYFSTKLKDTEECGFRLRKVNGESGATVSCDGKSPSFLLGLLTQKSLKYAVTSTAIVGTAIPYEMAFVFDISDSMVGQEIADLKTSLEAMTKSSIFNSSQSRLSFIPFANTVRLGPELKSFVTPGTGYSPAGGTYNGCFDRQATNPDIDLTSNPTFPLVNEAIASGRVVCPDESMTALFHKKATDKAIKNMIDDLDTAFGTGMSDGLVWGFRSLDPALQGVLSKEKKYPLSSSTNASKHVVMMTDGRPYDRPYHGPGGGSVTQNISLDRFKSVCAKLPFEDNDINFHLINYNNKKLSKNHIEVFEGCVSGVGKFHDVAAGDLASAINLITAQVSNLRITK